MIKKSFALSLSKGCGGSTGSPRTASFYCASAIEAQQQTITPQQLEEQKKKAEKFKAYYQKSEKCLSPIDHDARVACGNEHIRAKAKFEELYQQGKL